ncbi:MAG: adenosine kinase [Alphaproteobacteria bacterium]|nr:adenosine kinase [Alphaproteobacteria bacterium]
MSKGNLDVVGIGNAIVDVLSKTDDAFLQNNGIRKGAMTLIEAAQAEALYDKMGTAVEVSGGSAANTAAALASLGSKAGFIGKVAHDQLGSVFRHDIRATGVTFETSPLVKGVPTARCMILITPDAQRTMNTYLGACVYLSPEDLDEEMITGAQVTYLEGYLFDRDNAKRAFYKAAQLAHKANRKVALTLSDPFCVDRHREAFLDLVKEHVDILFANEAEIMSLYKVNDFDSAVAAARMQSELCVLTRSEKGSVIVSGGEMVEIRAEPVAKVVDTTGAGDLYAAGFLHGYTRKRDLKTCGRMAAVAAGEIIAQVGARPQRNLAELLKEKDAA